MRALTFCMFLLMLPASSYLSADDRLVFVSAFAAGEKGAIVAYHVNPDTGGVKQIHRTSDVEHPFFLALSPNRKFLYSIHAKSFGGKENEHVAAYRIVGRDGRLQRLNKQSALGTAACYLDVDATGKSVLVANYSTGSVASLPVGSDGSLGKAASFIQHRGASVTDRQKGPHAHCIVVAPNNRFVYAADLGLDKILNYRLDAKSARLVPNTQPFVRTPPGAGPRHLTFHPNGRHLYVVNELANSVTQYDFNSDNGVLIERQTISTLPSDFSGTSYCADLKITSNGKFLYATNRGHDSIAVYSLGADGQMKLVKIEPSLGKGPQNLAILPGDKILMCANMPSDNVAVFRIDPKTGELSSAGQPIKTPKPSCIMIY